MQSRGNNRVRDRVVAMNAESSESRIPNEAELEVLNVQRLLENLPPKSRFVHSPPPSESAIVARMWIDDPRSMVKDLVFALQWCLRFTERDEDSVYRLNVQQVNSLRFVRIVFQLRLIARALKLYRMEMRSCPFAEDQVQELSAVLMEFDSDKFGSAVSKYLTGVQELVDWQWVVGVHQESPKSEDVDDEGDGISFEESSPIPSWDANRKVLSYAGKSKPFAPQTGAGVIRILDSFQELNWPEQLDSPLIPGVDPESKNVIRTLNKSGVGICFSTRGEVISWQRVQSEQK